MLARSRLVLDLSPVLSQAKRIECAVRAVIKLYCTDVSCEWCLVNRLWVGWPSWWNPGNWSESGQRICCFNSFQVWVEREERSRSKRCAFVTRQRQPSQNPWTESWNGRSRRKMAQQRSYEAEAEVEPQKLGKEKFWYRLSRDQSGICISTISARIKQADGQIRLTETKISLYGDLELTNRVFEENHAERLPTNWRIVENLLRRNRSSKTCKNWWIVYASRGESYCCESVVDTDSGNYRTK